MARDDRANRFDSVSFYDRNRATLYNSSKETEFNEQSTNVTDAFVFTKVEDKICKILLADCIESSIKPVAVEPQFEVPSTRKLTSLPTSSLSDSNKGSRETSKAKCREGTKLGRNWARINRNASAGLFTLFHVNIIDNSCSKPHVRSNTLVHSYMKEAHHPTRSFKYPVALKHGTT
ncbi:hypothetical protein WN51_00347 [Melipona quadrifasciata]|uniref:Uncharacterized protein n=1 Tax=Melipona quadrifasciata TaxID=166423 RepID=A0A0M8ZZF8_9HYME|nr:hypothetical protein WN51_00347 [Melipona quadrifasciata]